MTLPASVSVNRTDLVPAATFEKVVETPPASAPRAHDAPSAYDLLDRAMTAEIARFTGGLSPAALALAFADWAIHLAASPGKKLALGGEVLRDVSRLADMSVHWATKFKPWSLIKPPPHDHRFTDPDWSLAEFNLLAQSFLFGEKWWHSATTDVRGVARSNAAIVDFTLRQCLDTLAPSNFALLNPEVLRKIMETGGGNFLAGWHHWIEDFRSLLAGAKPATNFVVGQDVATTKGKVVYRNELIELIQYEPTTATVRPEPVLIVPAWIMKYYILDLSPHNSLVKFLVDNGFSVFTISWRNPTPECRALSFEDYRKLGVDAAIAAINEIVPATPIHAAGYCLGGTLLSIAAARLARERPDCLRSVTLLAAQTDFTEAGELTLFINESQVAFLEDMMSERGVLDTTQMAGAFQILRSNDLIWSRVIRDYLLGEREQLSDLMSWNADATRMPYRMHSEYLRKLFLNNDLAEGRYRVEDKPVALSDLHAPMFVVGTQRDHVAPWRSTHKIHFLAADADMTYVLTSGGHNAGIVAPPNEEGHSYQILTKQADGPYVGPDEWIKLAPHHEGSWWLEWVRFLEGHSDKPVAPPSMGASQDGAPLPDAPGDYVLQR
jgi:poly[(R)-3-hydroxyalkanoate] polymerase subunit PhaC